MEVILKKTKITKSIVDQSVWGGNELFYNLNGHDILEWVNIKIGKSFRKVTLLYRRDSKQIIKLPYIGSTSNVEYFTEAEHVKNAEGNYIRPVISKIRIKFASSFDCRVLKQDYLRETHNDVMECEKQIKIIAQQVTAAGQIYI